jgi:hypothetical protein
LSHAVHSEALAEVDKIIDWLAACQESDGMVVIAMRFILVFVDPVKDGANSWVLASWGDCPLGVVEARNVFFFCYGGKFCCRDLRHSDWIIGEWC